jgi:hypothetical protein
MPQSTLIRSLAVIGDATEKNKMRNDWEGSSDKYARMIAGWLCKLGLVQKVGKNVTVSVCGNDYTETIGQSFMITAHGLTALNRAFGRSRHARISKNVCYEMLATKGAGREYLRTRRAYIIKLLSESRRAARVADISEYLLENNIRATDAAIRDDINGLQNIGFDIRAAGDEFAWNDKINDFVIPVHERIAEPSVEKMKDDLRVDITYISHDYLALLDLAYDGSQNRLFEMKTLALLTEECGYQGAHLGGSRKPDGVIYTDRLPDGYGVIIDTKAYSGGYNLPINQADEMQRYVQENQRRDTDENPNRWWDVFGTDIDRYYFMFVSGHFKGRYREHIERIAHITGTRGKALPVRDMLIAADKLKGDAWSYADAEQAFFE